MGEVMDRLAAGDGDWLSLQLKLLNCAIWGEDKIL